MHSSKRLLLALCFCITLTVAPFCVTEFIPVTDFSQHLNQAQIFYKTFYSGSDTFELNYFAPNTLVYYILFILLHFFPAQLAGKICLILLLQTGIAAVFFLAHSEKCKASQAVLGACFLFNTSFYWGFMPFMSGWPVFCLFWVWTRKSMDMPWHTLFIQGSFLSLFLGWSHNLWLLAAFAWMMYLSVTCYRKGDSDWIKRYFFPFLPAFFVSLIWFFSWWQMKVSVGVTFSGIYVFSLIQKILPLYFILFSNVPMHGSLPGIALLMVVYFAIMSIVRHKEKANIALVATGYIAFLFSFIAPYYYANTIFFAQRWLPYAMIFMILSLGIGEKKEDLRTAVCMAFFLAFVLMQTNAWVAFENNELLGWKDCLKSVPVPAKVVYVDHKRKSQYFRFYPFWQFVGYIELLGCETNFSFAFHNNGIARFKDKSRILKQESYNDMAELERSELKSFDYAVLHGDKEHKRQFLNRFPELKETSSTGFWHSFKVENISKVNNR